MAGVVLFAGGAAVVSASAQAAPAGDASTAAVKLPERLGSFEDLATIALDKSSKYGALDRKLEADTARLTIAEYQKAYHGASVAFRDYANQSLSRTVAVIAVRAPSPGLTDGPVAKPSDLGLAMDQNSVHSFGNVSCIVDAPLITAGNPVKPSSLTYATCQRSGPDLTVMVTGSQFQGATGLQTMLSLTNGAYDAALAGR